MTFKFIIAFAAVPIFLILCMRKPGIAFACIFAAAPFPNDIGLGIGLNASLGEFLTLIMFGQLLVSGRPVRFAPTLIPAILYISVCALSGILSGSGASAVALFQMGIYLILAVIVGASSLRKPEDVRSALHGLMLAGIFLGGIALATRSNYFLGLHKNAMGGALAAAFISSFVLLDGETRSKMRRLYLPATLVNLGGLLMIASRGAWMGAIVAIVVILAAQKKFAFAMRLGFLAALAVPIFWLLLPEDRQEFATNFSANQGSVSSRLDFIELAKENFMKNPVLGVGIGFRKMNDATNLVMSVLAESGVVGLMAFSLLLFTVFRLFLRGIRRCRYHPSMPFAIACMALFITKLVHGLVDHYWSRGVLLLGWLAVGMAWRVGVLAMQSRREELEALQATSPPPGNSTSLA